MRDPCFVPPEQKAGTFELARRGRCSTRLGPPPPSTLAAVLACLSPGGYVAVGPHTLAGRIALPGAGTPIPSEITIAFRKYERAPAVKAFLDFARRPETAT
ncbi:hypothetical protein [Paraburkholderia fungorum]|uniref:hypothetical protein n=1 Tax=Paraburkholderia fungorum TaxID=134537 RepID=UPI00209B9B6F|nr:hypothetical protein [Paraburkholderia fungorum]